MLVWRRFSKGLLHEDQLVFRTTRAEGFCFLYIESRNPEECLHHNYEADGSGARYTHYRYKVDSWPEPEDPVPQVQEPTEGLAVYWMDDLWLCPVCHRFHPYQTAEKSRRARAKFMASLGFKDDSYERAPWLVRVNKVTKEELMQTVSPRLSVPEFALKHCGGDRCAAAEHRDKDYQWHDKHTL